MAELLLAGIKVETLLLKINKLNRFINLSRDDYDFIHQKDY